MVWMWMDRSMDGWMEGWVSGVVDGRAMVKPILGLSMCSPIPSVVNTVCISRLTILDTGRHSQRLLICTHATMTRPPPSRVLAQLLRVVIRF